MDRGNKEKILDMIKSIDKMNSELKEYLSKLSISSRNELLKDITQDIIHKNSILQEFIGKETQIISHKEMEKSSSDILIDDYISKIQENPNKKIIFLREFLDLFQDRISENDKNVILNSLKDENNGEDLKERMKFLSETFKLNL